jgi:arylsulfatase A-like enzyme
MEKPIKNRKHIVMTGKASNSIKICLSLAGMGGLLSATATDKDITPGKNSTSDRPNFLFILADDLGYMDVGFNNPNTFYETPNLDRLATQSIRFTNAYAACPVSSPTRASILTGKYPARLHTTDYFGAIQPNEAKKQPNYSKPLYPAAYLDKLPLEEQTIAESLREAGYATFFAGKWHLGNEGFWPEDQGFDVNKGGYSSGGPYGGSKYFSPYGNPRLEDGPDGEHLPDRLASETVKFIKEHRNSRFLTYLSFYSVHTPLMTTEALKLKYEKKKTSAPEDSWGQEGERKVRLIQNHAVYAGMVEAMDQAIGKVLDYLKESGLDKTTVVIFMSDNGGLSTSEGHPTSNLPLRAGKGWLYEGGIREPMLIKWPGASNPGTICDEPVISTDFYPTILDLAGLKLKPELHPDGTSLVPLLKNKNLPTGVRDRALYWFYPHYGNQGGQPGSAIRKGKYKLIEFFADGTQELYDLSADIGEQNNLAAKLPKLRKDLSDQLHQWQKQINANFPEKRTQTNLQ